MPARCRLTSRRCCTAFPRRPVVSGIAYAPRLEARLSVEPLVGSGPSAAYQLAWWDAHMWAYAERHGIPESLSEDVQHGRRYGSVRAVDPFLGG